MENFISLSPAAADPLIVLQKLFLAFAIGLVISLTYQKTHTGLSYSRSFLTTIVLMCVLGSVVMSAINGGLYRKIGDVDLLADCRASEGLVKMFKKNGYFKNFYGRPLMSNNNLINHWIQSSTADYCILAFKNLLETKNDIEVHGVIHDAVVVSSSQKINFSSIKESISNIEIPVTIKKLSNI